jgi:hypothetical protein
VKKLHFKNVHTIGRTFHIDDPCQCSVSYLGGTHILIWQGITCSICCLGLYCRLFTGWMVCGSRRAGTTCSGRGSGNMRIPVCSGSDVAKTKTGSIIRDRRNVAGTSIPLALSAGRRYWERTDYNSHLRYTSLQLCHPHLWRSDSPVQHGLKHAVPIVCRYVLITIFPNRHPGNAYWAC